MEQQRPGGDESRRVRRSAPTNAAAWASVALLSVISVLSWVDRLIPSLLVTPIERDLGLTDAQFGLLLGLGFVGVYVLAGLPIAAALDRGRRKWILAGAVLLWCGSTVAAAFAPSFTVLLATRSGVAIGEAALMPAAISMISDLFPPHRRRLPTALFMTITILGATGAYLIGGLVISAADQIGVWRGLVPWRLSLIAVGLMGVPAAVVLMLMREPPRSGSATGSAGAAATWDHFRALAPLYFCLFTGSGLVLMMAQASGAWLPTLLTRGWHLSPAHTGAMMALTFAPASALGVALVSALAGRRAGRAAVMRLLTLALLVCVLSAPFAFAVRGDALTPLLATGALAMLGQGSVATLNAMLVQAVTPAAMRARVMALFLTLMNLISTGLAPAATAAVAGRLFGGPRALGGGLSVISAGGIAAGALLILVALAWSRRREFTPA